MNKRKSKLARTMRPVAVAVLLSLATCQALQCRRENGDLICEFRISEDAKEAQELSHCSGRVCVEANVVVVEQEIPSDDANHDRQLDSSLSKSPDDAQKSEPVVGTGESTNALIIAGQKYRVPFSQYGSLVAASLQERPSLQRSWQYGDWLIQFAIAVRGDPNADLDASYWDPSNIEKAYQILKLSVDLFHSLEESGFGDAKVSLGNAYMTMGETMIFDPYSPQYERSLDYFEISNKLFKEALDENKMPLGITHADAELNWADTLVRMAVLTVESQMGNLQLDLSGGGMTQFMKLTEQASAMLEDAIAAFRRLVDGTSPSSKEKLLQRRSRLANALQNFANTILMVQMDFEKTNALLEEAIAVYKECLKDMDEASADWPGTTTGVAESLYSLADGYLQSGKYDLAKERYRDAMQWHKKYNLASPAVQDVQIVDADETLAANEQALEEYNSMLYGGGELRIPNDRSKGMGNQIYQSDELYEADLHASIGALRMARGEAHLAMNHLANAIELYSRNPSGRSLGDARLNLAMVYFKQGEYELSWEEYADALEVYKKEIGEGKNPLVDGLEDLLVQHGADPDTLWQQAAAAREATGDGSDDKILDLEAYHASLLNATALSDEL